jgi:CRISPR-associated protein Cas2
MRCLLVYDIPDDSIRTRVADVCLDYGLERIQYSAFLGELAATHQEEMLLKIRARLGQKAGNVQLFPLCDRDWRQRRTIIQDERPTTNDE